MRFAALALLLVALPACGDQFPPAAPGGDTPGPTEPVNAITFTDVTALSQIDYDVVDVQMVTMETDLMAGGAAAGDFDLDGCVDLFVSRVDDTPMLWRNMGDGTFMDVSAAAGLTALGASVRSNGVACGDIDNDGDLDVYLSGLGTLRNYLLINDGAGAFTEEAVARGADVTTADTHRGYGVAMGDYDKDGYLDICVVEWGNEYLDGAMLSHTRLLRNLGSAMPSMPGHFEDKTIDAEVDISNSVASSPVPIANGSYAFSPRFVDMDDDGHLDLLMANDFLTSRLFWNDGDGTFTDGTMAAMVGTDENGMGSTVGDYDLDGRLDWFVTSIYDTNPDRCTTLLCNWGASGNRLYRNEGSRTFSDATDAAGVRVGGWGWGTSFFDMDNDSDLDLVMTNGIPFSPGLAPLSSPYRTDPMVLWRNDGGAFTEVSMLYGVVDTQMGKGLLVFDYDKDGDLDIFVVNNGGTPVLYRNEGGNDWGWLRVRTIGTVSNRDGIGARLSLHPTAASAPRIHEIDGGSNYLAQNERTAHFGLGEGATSAFSLDVAWPLGAPQSFSNLPANRELVVIEDVGLVGDLDGNGTLSADDAVALALYIADPGMYMTTHPGVDASLLGDVDQDGDVDTDDETALGALLP